MQSESSTTSLVNATTIDLICKLFSRNDYHTFAAQLTDAPDAENILDFILQILRDDHLKLNVHEIVDIERRKSRFMLELTNWTPLLLESLNVPPNLDEIVDIKRRGRRFMLKVITKMPVLPESLNVTGIRIPAQHYIGRGGFGQVFKGELRGEVVALKLLYKADNNIVSCLHQSQNAIG